VKVLDFGIAKVLVDFPSFTSALEATKAGPTAFTPRYGAPEQFNKQRGATGPWTDVFALALIFVELVTGEKALDGDDPTQLYIASADPTLRPTARGRGGEVTDAVEAVLDKALSVEPRQRYVDAGELWDALVAAAGLGGAVSGRPTSSGARTRAAALAENSGELATGVFAEKAELDVGLTPAALPLQATMPVESKATVRDATPVVVRAAIADAKTAMAPGADVAAGRGKKLAKDDPMAETPLLARLPDAPDEARAATATKPPVAAASSRKEGGRSAWPWIVGALLVVGGGAVASLWSGLATSPHVPPPPPSRPSAKASAAPVLPQASAIASASASIAPSAAPVPDASASALAAPLTPVPVPDDMTLIPAGAFTFGEGKDAPRVTISKPFYLDRTEVTVKAYQACVTKRLCSAADHVAMTPEGAEGAATVAAREFADVWTSRCNAPRKALEHPINCVDFTGAESYCRSLGRRLPTEAEWELAARGAEGRAYAWGAEAPDCLRACYDKNGSCLDRSAAVTTCGPGSHATDRTPEGVYDLGGGVSEWVADGFTTRPAGGIDPKGDPTAPLRVVRGGSFLDTDEKMRATTRTFAAPVMAHVTIGFRCAMDTTRAP
jgi:serine/threonine-protein kinase